MSATSRPRRRPAIQITDGRAARLHRMVRLLDDQPRRREHLLKSLAIGLRTFYRELELLRRCGVKVRLAQGQYRLVGGLDQAERLLPFPDPRLSFAEMAELSRGEGPAARRLGALLEHVLRQSRGPDRAVRKGRASNRRGAEASGRGTSAPTARR